MPAAIAIPAIIGAAGAGAQMYGAHKAAGAARDAANIQSRAADRAQQFNERVYNENTQRLNPYLQMGSDSLARLFSQHWGTPYQPVQGPAGMPPPGGAVPRFGAASGMPQQPDAAAIRQAIPRTFGGGGGSLAALQAQGGPQPGGLVKLQGPDGSVQAVPAQLADQFIARGAQRVG